MKSFPAEFSELLKPSVWSARGRIKPIGADRHRLRWFPLALQPATAKAGLALLDRHMAGFLRPMRTPVDPTSITGMKKNYSKALEKTLRNSSFSLNEERSKASAAANEIGLREMMLSPSLHAFAQTVSGYELEDDPALQVIRYSNGDYVGPHNDHHPEEPTLRDGYIDLQITLSNDAVARQYLLYEAGEGYFNALNNIGIASAVSVSKLPFWHQVTPLEAKPGREKAAVRWLLLASFLIKQGQAASKKTGQGKRA